MDHKGLLFIAVVDKGVDQPEGVWAFDLAADEGFEDLVINAGEVFADVALQDIVAGSHEVGEPT